jgi:hypothetical protein
MKQTFLILPPLTPDPQGGPAGGKSPLGDLGVKIAGMRILIYKDNYYFPNLSRAYSASSFREASEARFFIDGTE